MPAATKIKKPDALATFDRLDGVLADARERHQELSRELEEKRVILDGSDLNTPGLVQQLSDLKGSDPTQFKADGTPTGPDAKKLASAIDEVGDLGPLADEVEHTRLLQAKADRDLGSFVTAHVGELVAAKVTEAEGQAAAVEGALEHLRSALRGYVRFNQDVMGLLATAGRDTRVPGLDGAAGLLKALDDQTVPVPIPEEVT
jgi:hypothetical protein